MNTLVGVILGLGLWLFPCIEAQIDACESGDIRLVGGSSHLEGRVEVCFRGSWGTVCDDQWIMLEANANVACRQLGYSDQGATAVSGLEGFGMGAGVIVLDDLECIGDEGSLFECRPSSDCEHSEDVGVICQSDEVLLVHEGSVISNNSVLFLDSLASSPLQCVTTQLSCCDTNRSGNWFPPEGNAPLGAATNSTELYQSWGDDQSIRLHSSSETNETDSVESGLYRCEVPDRDGVTQTLYVGVYSNITADLGVVSISDISYDSASQTITCTSTGGPATSVTWSRDNVPIIVDGNTYQRSQLITDTSTATYQNRLRIVSKSASLSGTYRCSVENTMGMDEDILDITVCRNDVFRVARSSDLDAVIELCVDDQWLPISNSLQFSTDQFAPRNLQLSSLRDGLSVLWEAPLLESGEMVVGYDVRCTQTQSGDTQHTSSLTVDGTTTAAFVTVMALETTEYSCCVASRIQRDMLTLFSPEVCDTAQFIPPLVSTSTQESTPILVPILGVLAGVFFLALLVVSVALVLFMTSNNSKMKSRVEDRENLEQETERKEPDASLNSSNPIYASINQNEVRGTQQLQQQQQQQQQQRDSAGSPVSQAPNVSNPMYSSIDHLEPRRSFVLQRTERIAPIQRSNSSSAIINHRTRAEEDEGEGEGEGLPLYSTIVPRHLRKHNRSSSTEQELAQEEVTPDGQEVNDTQTYSTLKH